MRQLKYLIRFDLVEGALLHDWVVQESSHTWVSKALSLLSFLGFLLFCYLIRVLDILYLQLNLLLSKDRVVIEGVLSLSIAFWCIISAPHIRSAILRRGYRHVHVEVEFGAFPVATLHLQAWGGIDAGSRWELTQDPIAHRQT